MAERLGRQTPTQSVVLPYTQTKGQEAIELYNKTGRIAQEWQELMMSDIMAMNEDGLWVHAKFGYSVPRRNGKNEIVSMREMWALPNGEHVMHTAHRTATSHAAWERLITLLSKSGFKEDEDYKTYKQLGFESVEWLKGEGKVNFRTRSSKGGLGEGYDLLIIDEAQEYQDDQESALKYVVSDSKNPQTLMCGTPPTPVSSGTVFTKYRKSCLLGQTKDSGWAEWSVDKMSDVNDVELWYQCNPSMGTILDERKVGAEIGDDIVDFNIQRLGLWIQYNQKSAISKTEWEALKVDGKPTLQKTPYVGIKFGVDGSNIALSVAVKTTDERIFIEVLDCQPTRNGLNWVLGYLDALKPGKVVIDGASGQKMLEEAMKKKQIRGAVLPTVKEVIAANSLFEQAIFNKTICHANQPSLLQAASNCERRPIGSNGGFGYKAQKEGIEIALLDSAILAYWVCSQSKAKRKQQINY